MNLAQLLPAPGAIDERLALKLDDEGTTYGELHRQRALVAGWLGEIGVGAGDRVGLMMPNVPQFAPLYYGVLSVGAIAVPLNVLLKAREVSYHLEDSGAKLLIAWNGGGQAAVEGVPEGTDLLVVGPGDLGPQLGVVEPAAAIVDREPGDTAVLLYTSGTTGRPKGAQLTHGNLHSNALAARELFGTRADDVVFGGLPLFHSFGQTCALNASLSIGATVTMLPRFDPGKALEVIARDRVTVFMGVPTMYAGLLNHEGREEFDIASLRVAVSGGAPIPVEMLRQFERDFDCQVLEGYGLSETSPVASFNHRHRERKPGSIGTPIAGVEMRVVDADRREVAQGEVGEIAIRGQNVMRGYWAKPEATAEAIDDDGWFYSGDIAFVDEDGYFFIVDRKKDMIIRGGYNVYPREIEEVLYEHPAVREAAVLGVPHDKWGEEVGAAVALKADAAADADELRDFVRDQVAGYKYPRLLWIVEELPKGPTGKILKREIELPTATRAEG
jgi:long-chain acyl-CoA synthetase